PLIIQYGALGAAIGTTLASITMIFFAHRIAQRAATLDWKWGSILPLVICHLLAVALVTEFHRGDYRLLVELPTKFCVLLGYILIGVRLGLLNRNSLRAIYSLQKSDEVR
ncbi:MAG: O-antigen/teichoic acid export membrane protein, partial [Lentimonas sp.]